VLLPVKKCGFFKGKKRNLMEKNRDAVAGHFKKLTRKLLILAALKMMV